MGTIRHNFSSYRLQGELKKGMDVVLSEGAKTVNYTSGNKN